MIQEIDEALRALVREEALRGPESRWSSTPRRRSGPGGATRPTVDVYLYDIREDLRRRARG